MSIFISGVALENHVNKVTNAFGKNQYPKSHVFVDMSVMPTQGVDTGTVFASEEVVIMSKAQLEAAIAFAINYSKLNGDVNIEDYKELLITKIGNTYTHRDMIELLKAEINEWEFAEFISSVTQKSFEDKVSGVTDRFHKKSETGCVEAG